MALDRTPQTKTKTAATVAVSAPMIALALEEFTPDLSPGKVTLIVYGISLLVGFAGSTARDWVNDLETRGETPNFMLRKIAHIG